VTKPPDFLQALAEAIQTEDLLPPEARLVVGVSGGADSVALLHALHELARSHDFGWKIHVGHLHHGIRGSRADEDARFVEDLAGSLDLPVTVERVDVPALAKARHQSLEEAGREARYRFLERLCLRTDSKFIVLGHHADDNAETVLHRILRGTGIRGLAGIVPSRPLSPDSEILVVRPLLRFRREQIRKFLRSRGLQWREDHTNTQTSLTRNRLRHEVMPLIQARINTRSTEALLRLAQQARSVEAYLRETAQRTLETLIITKTDQQLVLNLPALLKRSRVIQAELIRQALLSLRVGEQQIDHGHITSVLHLAEQAGSNKRIHLPGRITVARRYDKLVLSLPSKEAPPEQLGDIAVRVPGRTILTGRGMVLETQILAFEPDLLERVKQKNDPWTELIDYDRVKGPLVVRSRRPGDRFWPLGGPGSKKLSDFFIEKKIDSAERDRIALLCDQRGPIWVLGLRIDERVRLHDQTRRVLQLLARPLEAER